MINSAIPTHPKGRRIGLEFLFVFNTAVRSKEKQVYAYSTFVKKQKVMSRCSNLTAEASTFKVLFIFANIANNTMYTSFTRNISLSYLPYPLLHT